MEFNWNAALDGKLGPDAKERTEECKGYADDFKAVVDGSWWIPEGLDYYDSSEVIVAEEQPEGYRQVYVGDLLEDNFGAWVTVNWDGEVTATRVLLAFGGPNIYLDTCEEAIEMYWGSGEYCYPISSDVCKAVDSWGKDYFECVVLPKIQRGGLN